MRSHSIFPAAVATLLLAASPSMFPTVAAAADAPATGEARAVTEAERDALPATPGPGEVRYGPIQARDPEVRAQIRRLYDEQATAAVDTEARLAQLVADLQAAPRGEAQLEIQRRMEEAKQALLLRSTELGLEIAMLNEDAARVADFEQALDRLRNPEKYRPAPADPAIARERARQLGLEK
ncbi:MAG: hypothetical protein R3B81_19375 [bacterium]